jgi:hypothetical protein
VELLPAVEGEPAVVVQQLVQEGQPHAIYHDLHHHLQVDVHPQVADLIVLDHGICL